MDQAAFATRVAQGRLFGFQNLAVVGQDHQHPRVRVPGLEERLLKGCCWLAAPHDAEHVLPTKFDGNNRHQDDPSSV